MRISKFNSHKTLKDYENVPRALKKKVENLLSSETIGHRYALGRNEHALALSQSIEITGFIDDFAEAGCLWNERPVVKISDLSPLDVAINCSMSISPVSAWRKLKGSESLNILNYSDCCRARPDIFILPDFVIASRNDLIKNELEIITLYNNLADDESRVVLKAIMDYRITADPNYMKDFSVRFEDQYFEDFLTLDDAVFVDAGGYDGDTTEQFCKRFPSYKRVYFFEPSDANMNSAKKRLALHRDTEFIQQGLSESSGYLWFNPDAASASSVSVEGTTRIHVNTLDNFVAEKVSFIKIDLEGWQRFRAS